MTSKPKTSSAKEDLPEFDENWNVVPQKTKSNTAVDKVSFMRLIDESDTDDDEAKARTSHVPSNKTHQKPSTSGESNDNNDPDFNDQMSGLSDTSSVEYVTDDEEDDGYAAKKKKKNYKRTCMDDGDEELFLKRYKQLEKSEKRKQQEENEALGNAKYKQAT